jgi:hypothetical protein
VAENLYCENNKGTNQKYREGYDQIKWEVWGCVYCDEEKYKDKKWTSFWISDGVPICEKCNMTKCRIEDYNTKEVI